MKLAIVSDLHIGYERFYDDAEKQAREALEAASVVADAILIAGDVFDKRSPKPEVIAQAINIFRDISKKSWKAKVVSYTSATGDKNHTTIPVIAIPGTHERTSEGKENVLALLGLAGLLVDASEATVVIESGGESVAVFGLGGVSEERVKETLARLSPTPIKNSFNVFMLHQSIYELLPFSEDFIHYEDLPEGFDLYIDGHMHSRSEANVHGKKFLIPGSTVLTQLKDGEQEKKGFILFDTDTYSHEFIPINSRTFVSLHVKLSDASPKDVLERCEKEIDAILSKNKDKPIIKLYLDGSIAHGFNNTDVPIRSVLAKYSEKTYLEIDTSNLVSPDLQKSIDEIRANKIGELPVKELGMNTFIAKLKELKFGSDIDASRLFEILSGTASKDKVLKEATELLEKS